VELSALLEKPPVAQPLTNFPKSYGIQTLVTLFTRDSPMVYILSQINPVHTTPSHLSKWFFFNIVIP
jgi:hypothetical protein